MFSGVLIGFKNQIIASGKVQLLDTADCVVETFDAHMLNKLIASGKLDVKGVKLFRDGVAVERVPIYEILGGRLSVLENKVKALGDIALVADYDASRCVIVLLGTRGLLAEVYFASNLMKENFAVSEFNIYTAEKHPTGYKVVFWLKCTSLENSSHSVKLLATTEFSPTLELQKITNIQLDSHKLKGFKIL